MRYLTERNVWGKGWNRILFCEVDNILLIFFLIMMTLSGICNVIDLQFDSFRMRRLHSRQALSLPSVLNVQRIPLSSEIVQKEERKKRRQVQKNQKKRKFRTRGRESRSMIQFPVNVTSSRQRGSTAKKRKIVVSAKSTYQMRCGFL